MTKYINPFEQNQFINKIFFKKYKVIKSIAAGSYGCVFEGLDLIKKEKVAIKLEKKSYVNFIEAECSYLLNLKGYGTPKVISFGISGNYYVLVEELLGKSLQMILNEKKTINIKDSCMIAIQMLDRLEYIHSKYIIHRDIKPANFLIGDSNPEVIYLVDFGFARKYRSSFSKKHLKLSNIKSAIGSVYYISINANLGLEQSRRDDLEAFGYSLIYMMRGSLPWEVVDSYNNLTTLQKIYKICEMKKEIKLEKLCENLPKQMIDYLNYCRELHFEQDPDYNYLRNLFREILLNNNSINDLNFSWVNINNLPNENSKSFKKKIESSDSLIKSRGFRNRLFNKISESLSKKKNDYRDVKSEEQNIILPKKKVFKNESVVEKLNPRSQKVKIKINDTKNIQNNYKKIGKINNTAKFINNYYKNQEYEKILKTSYFNCKNNIIRPQSNKENKTKENRDINKLKDNVINTQHFTIFDKNKLKTMNINDIYNFQKYDGHNIKKYRSKFYSFHRNPKKIILKKKSEFWNSLYDSKFSLNDEIGNLQIYNDLYNFLESPNKYRNIKKTFLNSDKFGRKLINSFNSNDYINNNNTYNKLCDKKMNNYQFNNTNLLF